jgi:hypothetical protein
MQLASQQKESRVECKNDDFDENCIHKKPQGAPSVRHHHRRWRDISKRLKRGIISMAFATAVLWHRPGTATAAAAAAAAATKEKPQTMSIRPGMTRKQAERMEQGDVRVIEQIKAEVPSTFTAPPTSTSEQKKTSVVDYGDDEEDEEDHILLEESDYLFPSGPASQSDKIRSEKIQAKTVDKFAAQYRGKSKSLSIKVGVAFFVPTYGVLIVREYIRRRREEAYVKKGLEILEAQKAEYFNITETTPDSDVQDALKGLKKNATKTDDDDDDDDDEDDDDNDDDDEPEPPSRRPPRKPKGDGGGGQGGGSDRDNGKPSDKDIDKLKNIFNKS